MTDSRGQALAEFCIAVTFALVLLLSIAEFGRAAFVYNLVSNASRLGSRYAMVRGSGCPVTVPGCPATAGTIAAYVQGQSPGVNVALLTVTATWSSNAGCVAASPTLAAGRGCTVSVTVSYPFASMLAFDFPTTISSTSQMVISQ